jgi:hypothetical protein
MIRREGAPHQEKGLAGVNQFTSAGAGPAVSFVQFRISLARDARTADWASGEPRAEHTEVIV